MKRSAPRWLSLGLIALPLSTARPCLAEQPAADAGTPQASAESPAIEEARRLFWQAHDHYEHGDYAEAAALFERSYALAPQPEVLFNIAMSKARAQRCPEAWSSFDDYVRRAVQTAPADAQTQRGQLAELCPPDAVSPAPTAPATAAPAPPNAPPAQPAPVALPPAPLAEAAPPESYWTARTVTGWSLIAASALTTGAAFYFNANMKQAVDDEHSLSQGEADEYQARYPGLEDDYQRAELGRTVATVTASVLALAGLGVLVWPAESTPTLSAGCERVDLTLSGHF